MTSEYNNREPVPAVCSLSPELLVAKWSHSITFEPTFLTEWGAVEKARSLAFELDTYNGIFVSPQLNCNSRHVMPSKPEKRVRFSGDLDVRVGDADSHFVQFTVPCRALKGVTLQGHPGDLQFEMWLYAKMTYDDDAESSNRGTTVVDPQATVCISGTAPSKDECSFMDGTILCPQLHADSSNRSTTVVDPQIAVCLSGTAPCKDVCSIMDGFTHFAQLPHDADENNENAPHRAPGHLEHMQDFTDNIVAALPPWVTTNISVGQWHPCAYMVHSS